MIHAPARYAIHQWPLSQWKGHCSCEEAIFLKVSRHNPSAFYHHNHFQNYPSQHLDLLAGCQPLHQLEIPCQSHTPAWSALKSTLTENPGWWFGALSYDLKNQMEALQSPGTDPHEFPLLHFFQAGIVYHIQEQTLSIYSALEAPHTLYQELQEILPLETTAINSVEELTPRISKTTYLQTLEKLLAHIHRGDFYEINYCQEFYRENCPVDPVPLFLKLNALAQTPFAAWYRCGPHHVLSASPERYLSHRAGTLISQPIKGTRARHPDPETDALARETLRNDPKERSENTMIVDLVRNDLSKVASKGSVQVQEWMGIYSFRHVHQMISTVTAHLAASCHPVDALQSCFPMGSMTGAPKISAMSLSDQYEASARGIYSGAVGYISPDLDFDFNVVIRSLLYHSTRHYLSYQVGGAITALSVPEQEYEECMVKARAMRQA
jgi:para-aminobenzoate synthetase component 1